MDPQRVAIITGAAQGIGRATTLALGREGYALVIVDRQETASFQNELSTLGIQAVSVVGDLTDNAVIASIVKTALETYERIDVIVNNAGISAIQPAEDISRSLFEQVLAVNLVAPFLLSQACYPHMKERRQGAIINIASIAGLLGVADRAAYNASKHGLVGLTRTLAAEWGGWGIRCNAICPGWVKTEMDAADQGSGAYSDADIIGRVPMGRFASPHDIAQGVVYLADPERSGFINGHTLVIDGGWTADASWETLRLAHRPE